MSGRLQQVLGQSMREFEQTKHVMELNPQSNLITRLCELSNNSDNDEFIRDCGRQLFANAQILDGLIPDVEDTTGRTLRFMEDLARSKSAIVV
jgi:molecular chaperone HtpG